MTAGSSATCISVIIIGRNRYDDRIRAQDLLGSSHASSEERDKKETAG